MKPLCQNKRVKCSQHVIGCPTVDRFSWQRRTKERHCSLRFAKLAWQNFMMASRKKVWMCCMCLYARCTLYPQLLELIDRRSRSHTSVLFQRPKTLLGWRLEAGWNSKSGRRIWQRREVLVFGLRPLTVARRLHVSVFSPTRCFHTLEGRSVVTACHTRSQ